MTRPKTFQISLTEGEIKWLQDLLNNTPWSPYLEACFGKPEAARVLLEVDDAYREINTENTEKTWRIDNVK